MSYGNVFFVFFEYDILFNFIYVRVLFRVFLCKCFGVLFMIFVKFSYIKKFFIKECVYWGNCIVYFELNLKW